MVYSFNSQGYLERNTARSIKCKSNRNWFLIKDKGQRGGLSFPQMVYFPKNLIGKRVLIKLEEIK
jgi:hypothetical protein